MKILVTGGSGFIGSAVVRHILRTTSASVVNLDKLTYAACPEALEECGQSPRYSFEQRDVCDLPSVVALFEDQQPDTVIHLAAESHVDRSINGPAEFIRTNIVGSFALLQAARGYFENLHGEKRNRFRLVHVSTDEVYGDLQLDEPAFTEETPYSPDSPYSASKAASDHLVRAWDKTFGLPTIVTHCSNNYGPWQSPEKLVPVVIAKAREGSAIPIYGSGENVRDWIHVADHAEALWTVVTRGRTGEVYNIGGNTERRNIDLVRHICAIMDERFPECAPHFELATRIADRPGHDYRYAVNVQKIRRDLGWEPRRAFETGISETVAWYLDHEPWWKSRLERMMGSTCDGLTTPPQSNDDILPTAAMLNGTK